MVPHFEIPSLKILGPVAIQPFGVLVASAVIVGAWLTGKRAQDHGLKHLQVRNMIFWSVLIGFLSAHFLDVVFYEDGPWDERRFRLLLDPRSNLSSMGGFFGAVVGLVAWCRVHRQRIMPYADSLAFGLAPGWILGRLGCFVAHDHPGERTSFFLGVAYPCDAPVCPPRGGFHMTWHSAFARHDLGLYEALFAACVTVFFLVARRWMRPRAGFFVACLALFYAPIRFALDFLRVPESAMEGADPRYASLTPAQYAAIAVFLAGLGVLWAAYGKRYSQSKSA